MAQIRWSPQIADDLEEICDYIGRDSPRYAALFAERVFSVLDMIAAFPLAGGIVPEYGREDVRERLIYRLRGGNRVSHAHPWSASFATAT